MEKWNWKLGLHKWTLSGNNASRKLKLVCFTTKKLYIGKCYDHQDSLSQVLSTRDDFNPNLDVAGVFIDTYSDKTGFLLEL